MKRLLVIVVLSPAVPCLAFGQAQPLKPGPEVQKRALLRSSLSIQSPAGLGRSPRKARAPRSSNHTPLSGLAIQGHPRGGPFRLRSSVVTSRGGADREPVRRHRPGEDAGDDAPAASPAPARTTSWWPPEDPVGEPLRFLARLHEAVLSEEAVISSPPGRRVSKPHEIDLSI